MAIRNSRLRRREDLAHNPNGHGIRKWHSKDTLWRYKQKARRKRQIAKASRRRNRAC